MTTKLGNLSRICHGGDRGEAGRRVLRNSRRGARVREVLPFKPVPNRDQVVLRQGEATEYLHAEGFAGELRLLITLLAQLRCDMGVGEEGDKRDGNDRGQDEEQEYPSRKFTAKKAGIGLDHISRPPQ